MPICLNASMMFRQIDNSDDDNYSHHYSDDYDYTTGTVHNDQYNTAQSYNSAGAYVNASVNASVAGSKQYKHIAKAHETDMMPA